MQGGLHPAPLTADRIASGKRRAPFGARRFFTRFPPKADGGAFAFFKHAGSQTAFRASRPIRQIAGFCSASPSEPPDGTAFFHAFPRRCHKTARLASPSRGRRAVLFASSARPAGLPSRAEAPPRPKWDGAALIVCRFTGWQARRFPRGAAQYSRHRCRTCR